jgi:hypothetical protein
MKPGDIIVCIDNKDCELELTLDKSYKLLEKRSLLTQVWIEDDLGKMSNYLGKRFILLSEFRSRKLGELGI